jgi:hypothetical protein
MVNFILSLIDLFFVDRYRRNRDLVRERNYLNRVMTRKNCEFIFLKAYDATLMVREDRLKDALTRFEEALIEVKDDSNSDQKYVMLYCKFFLSLYSASGDSKKYIEDAIKIDASPLIRIFLRFPKKEDIEKVLVQ